MQFYTMTRNEKNANNLESTVTHSEVTYNTRN